jgi:hypothetical protein
VGCATVDVAVIGCGPAGLALAAQLGVRGLSVALLGPDLPFVNNYGVWVDEMEALGFDEGVFEAQVPTPMSLPHRITRALSTYLTLTFTLAALARTVAQGHDVLFVGRARDHRARVRACGPAQAVPRAAAAVCVRWRAVPRHGGGGRGADLRQPGHAALRRRGGRCAARARSGPCWMLTIVLKL